METDPSRTPYEHRFVDGHGGWFSNLYDRVRIWDGVAHSYSPWFLDANHAPPGAGYLHLILWIYTDKRWYLSDTPWTRKLPYRTSSFVDQGKSKDLRGAKLTVRLRGEVDLKGAQLLLLAQAQTAKTRANIILTGQPIRVTESWSEQTIVLANDPKQWTCLGSRKARADLYGCDELDTVLGDVNVDLIFALFPLEVVPACKDVTDLHGPEAGIDYPVLTEKLPKGLIQFESVRIEYPPR